VRRRRDPIHPQGRFFSRSSGRTPILETSPKIAQARPRRRLESRQAGDRPRKLEARYVVRYGRPIEMPARRWDFLRRPVSPPRPSSPCCASRSSSRGRDGVEESIAQFCRAPVQPGILDHAIDALRRRHLRGDPHKLSLPHAFPSSRR